jgi:peptidyl-prolyl cis-trans isomerase A (cyclophilin A)
MAATGGGGSGGADDNVFQVLLETTVGDVVLEVHRDWAPNGANHFEELVEAGFYDNCSFFRVLPGFVAQWGLNGDPALNTQWASSTIPDDPVIESNLPGMITFAQTGQPNSRTTQLFVNYEDNSFLDAQNFAPFATVISGMAALEAINAEYGEQPNQNLIRTQGDTYLDANFPNLDRITKATIQ